MQAWWVFTVKFFCFFLSICRFERLRFTKPAYTQKISTFWRQQYIHPAYTPFRKNFDSEKPPNLHILKKIKNFRLYVGLTGIDELLFDFFEYMQVWGLFTIKIFVFLSICRVYVLLASKCWSFLSICRFGEPQVSNLHFCNLRMIWYFWIYFPLSISI